MKAFDPFKILDISPEATSAEIKKAYRRKSLETHPDRNPDDPLASSKFLQVTKAHMALTDEVSVENYKKYGNPDGPGPMKVAIGLPYFLMKKENQIMSLCVSFLFILVVIPSVFFFWYSGSYSYTDKGLKQEDEKAFAAALNENISFTDLPKLIAWANDFQHITIKNKQDLERLAHINKTVLNNKGPLIDAKKGRIMKNYKPHLLLMAYMFRGDLPKEYRDDIKDIVEKVPSLIDLWMEISLMFHIQYRSKRVPKNMTFKAMNTILKFSQHVIQGMWEFDSELLQLPYTDTERVNKISKKMQKKSPTLKDYISLSPEDRKAQEIYSDSELATIEKYIKNLPDVKVSAEVVTEGAEDIVVLDLVSIIIKVDRTNLQEGEKAPPVCSQTYPFMKTEKYFVYMTDFKDLNVFSHIKFDGNDKVQEKTIKFQAPPTMIGNVVLNIHCFSDSYVGLNTKTELKFTVKKESEVRTMFKYHEEDIKREPTLFEQVLQGMNEENSDDDLEEEDEDETASKSMGSKKSQAKINSDEEVEDEKDD